MKVAYILDPPEQLNPSGDGSIELIRSQQKRGDEVHVVLRSGLIIDKDELLLAAAPISASDDDVPDWATLGETKVRPATYFDAIMQRLEPPVDSGYRLVCQMLTHAQTAGVVVANDPNAIITREEKLAALRHAQLMPNTLVSGNRSALLDFASKQESGCVLKPLDGYGGNGVFAFAPDDSNLAVAIDGYLSAGKTLLIQERLAEIKEGDRRVFIVGGKPYPVMLNRRPMKGSHLANMIAGGEVETLELGDAERTIGEAIGPDLMGAGIILAGIDVIGSKLTEINITCPTGMRPVRDRSGHDVAGAVIDELAKLL